jgi:hypothetical protein
MTCGHAKEHRGPMSADRRDEVLLRFGLSPGAHPDYEIDHLIPLCLGGSDDPSNLWPQPRRSIEPKWNAEAKDRLERLICDMVCGGQLDIATAQEAFAKDWVAAYQKYFEHSAAQTSRIRVALRTQGSPAIRGNGAVVRHGATAPSTKSGAVLLELSRSRMRDIGWDQLPPDVRFAGGSLQKRELRLGSPSAHISS